MKNRILFIIMLLSVCGFASAKQNNSATEAEYIVLNDSSTLSYSVYRAADRSKGQLDAVEVYDVINGVTWQDTLRSGVIGVAFQGLLHKVDVPVALRDTMARVSMVLINGAGTQTEVSKSLDLAKLKFAHRRLIKQVLSEDANIPGVYTVKIDCDATQQHFEHEVVISDSALCCCTNTNFRSDGDSVLKLEFYTSYPHTLTTEQLRALSVPYVVKQESSIIKKDTIHLDDAPALPEKSAVYFIKELCTNMNKWTPGEYTFSYVDPFNGVEVEKLLQVVAAEVPDTTSGPAQNRTIITYTAISKLPETTDSNCPGVFIHAFDLGMATIVSHTFENGEGTIVLDKTVTTFGTEAFSHCPELTSITIPETVTWIERKAFYQCINLRSVFIPDTVSSIESRAFEGCMRLDSVILPKNLATLSRYAFRGCSNLMSVTLPEKVEIMDAGVFSECESLVEIKVAPGNPNYDSRNNCNAIIDTRTDTLITGCSETIIPEDVVAIDREAFSSVWYLESIRIPGGVTSIGPSAFSDCICLSEIISEATTPPVCGKDCFQGVDKTIPVYVPAGTKVLYETANQWKDFLNIIEGIPGSTAPEGVIEAERAVIVRKAIENGQFVIIRDGKRYNLNGTEF